MTEQEGFDNLFREIWDDLVRAVGERRNPFHTPVVASLGPDGVEAHVVALRRVTPEQREITFHTDLRAQKILRFRENPNVEWVFYDAARKVQIRARGRMSVHAGDDPIARDAWERTRLMSRRCYLAEFGSGTILDAPSSGLPAQFEERSPSLEESEAGYVNFAVCMTTVHRFEHLHLAARGHLRRALTWNGETFEQAWLAP
jgi:3-hydroxyisobutyrate dehydrogenase